MRCHEAFLAALEEVESIAQHSNDLLASRERHSQNVGNAISRSGLVLLCGHFEGFIRELALEAIDRINQLELDPRDLPENLIAVAMEQAVQASGAKRQRDVANLTGALRDGRAASLDRKRLSGPKGNPSVENIEKIFSAFGLDSVIDQLSIADFGVQSTFVDELQSQKVREKLRAEVVSDAGGVVEHLCEIVDTIWTPRIRRREVGYVSAVQELLKKRNRIAHGEGREIVTPTELLVHVDQLRKLGQGLVNLMAELIADIGEHQGANSELGDVVYLPY